jgi:hypothetical protein
MNFKYNRGLFHLFLYFINLPLSILFLYPLCTNVSNVLAVSLFTFSNLFEYGFSAVQHGYRHSRKEYKNVKILHHLATLFSQYCRQLVIALLVFVDNMNLCLTLTFLASFTLPSGLKSIQNEDILVPALIKQSLVYIPFLHFIFYFQNPNQTIYFLLSFFVNIFGLYIYSNKVTVYYNELYQFFNSLVFMNNFLYIRSSLL